MKIYNSLQEFSENHKNEKYGLIIGNFDGVHLGHQQLLKKVMDDCHTNKRELVVLTFIPHPQKIIHPERKNFLITSFDQRRKLLEAVGVNFLIEFNFTRDISTLTAEDFFKNFILNSKNIEQIFVGYDFALGANKQGTIDVIQKICEPYEIKVVSEKEFSQDNHVVSSSLIREKISNGEMKDVSSFLGKSFVLEGVVIKGEGRGRQIGFPTANLNFHEDQMIPAKGVYITRTILSGMTYKSITNIGNNPTFKSDQVLNVETNIFDFSRDIYGEKIQIEFIEKIRDEKKFSTVNDLVTQISQDVAKAKKY